jgi:hypothetical protein
VITVFCAGNLTYRSVETIMLGGSGTLKSALRPTWLKFTHPTEIQLTKWEKGNADGTFTVEQNAIDEQFIRVVICKSSSLFKGGIWLFDDAIPVRRKLSTSDTLFVITQLSTLDDEQIKALAHIETFIRVLSEHKVKLLQILFIENDKIQLLFNTAFSKTVQCVDSVTTLQYAFGGVVKNSQLEWASQAKNSNLLRCFFNIGRT